MTDKEVTDILNKHEKWLRDEEGGERANLRDADLCGAKLRGANLYGADICGAYLCEADLRGANLSRADLRRASLRDAALRGANLYGTKLHGANLYGANLRGVDIPVLMACPSCGAFIGWKKVLNKIIKLEIPEDAKRCSATTEKCRCSKAKVLAIEEFNGEDSGLAEIINKRYAETIYKVGEIVYPDSFDEDRWNECSHGIHFFTDRESAVRW